MAHQRESDQGSGTMIRQSGNVALRSAERRQSPDQLSMDSRIGSEADRDQSHANVTQDQQAVKKFERDSPNREQI
jgi:hypothetical protein